MSKTPSSKPAVLITGCSSGLGRALAVRFAQADYPTYATARSPESIDELADLGCITLAVDVTDESSIKAAVARVEDDHGSVGIVVNNAAIGLMAPLEIVPISTVREQYETNVFGLLAVCQTALPAMRRAGKGRIVNIGSSGGEWTTPAGGVYQATKYAVDSMSDALRMETKAFGIDVVLIEPGAISSSFAKNGAVIGGDGGPYEQLMRGVDKLTSQAIEPGAPGTWTPEQVAERVFQASVTNRPRTRYRIGFVSKVLIKMRDWLPDRVWDRMFLSLLNRIGRNA